MNRSRWLVTFPVLFVLAVFAAAPLAADPVVNTFKVSANVPTLTVGRKYPFTFRLFDSASGGIPLFEEVRKYVVPGSQTISHQLGSVNLVQPLLAEDFLQQLWLEVSVPYMLPFPRIALVPAPLAIGSQNADMLDDQHAVDFALVGHSHGPGPALDADTLDGQHGTFYQDADNLSSGTLSDMRLSGNVALLDAAQTVSGAKTFNPPGGAAPFAVAASNTAVVTNLNADLLDGKHASELAGGGVTSHGELTLLDADDHPQYHALAQDETVTGRPAFNGGTTGSTAPFSVDSAFVVNKLNADMLDGRHRPEPYAGVLVVDQSAESFFTDPAAAMEAVREWCPSPGPANRCLLRIMPGVYSLNSELRMQSYVDVEGSGENTTVLEGSFGTAAGTAPTRGVVTGASAAELRGLSVRATYAGLINVAIFNGGSSPTITGVTATAAGGTNAIGIFNADGAAPLVRQVTVTAEGSSGTAIGIENRQSAPVLSDVVVKSQKARMAYGVRNIESGAVLSRVSVDATGTDGATGIYNYSSDASLTDVTAAAAGYFEATGVDNLSCSNLRMRNVHATAQQADFAIGVNNSNTDGTLTGITAEARGGRWAYGVYFSNGARALLAGSVARAWAANVSADPAFAYGVFGSSDAAATLVDVVASAEGEDYSYGVRSENAGFSLTNVKATGTCVAPEGDCTGIGTVSYTCAAGTCWTTTADRCTFAAIGATPYRRSVYVVTGVALKIGSSALVGPIGNYGGTLACVGNYDGESYAPVVCP